VCVCVVGDGEGGREGGGVREGKHRNAARPVP
jgi:hypothetical protein